MVMDIGHMGKGKGATPAHQDKEGRDYSHRVEVGGKVVVHFHESDLEKDEEEDIKVRWNMRRTAEKPCMCFCELCGVWVALILLLGVLATTVSSIEFSLDIPFYNQAEINEERENAYEATQRDADFVSTFGEMEAQECVHKNPTELTRNGTLITGPAPTQSCQRSSSVSLRLVYLSKDRKSNILTPENLQRIAEIESRILNHPHLSRYCLLEESAYPAFETRDRAEITEIIGETAGNEENYTSCARMTSMLNLLDPLYFDYENNTGLGYHLMSGDLINQQFDYEALPDVVTFWSEYSATTYDLSGYSYAVSTVGSAVTVPNQMWYVTSSDFGPGSTSAVGLLSSYSLGLPINSYDSPSFEADEQYEDIGQWLYDEFDSFLKDASFTGVDVFWSDSEDGMLDAETGVLAMQSMMFFPASLIAVLLYLIYMQDSIFVGIMGIGQILLCFVPTLLVYRYVVGEDYLGILNLVSIYIILGIGVDNIFVFCDQFTLYKKEKRVPERFQKTLNVGGMSMFTTSCTTFISFVANATSAFPAVSTFGVFSALLVVMNFIAIVTFFPSVYSVYYAYVRHIWWDHPMELLKCSGKVPAYVTKSVQNAEQKEAAKEPEPSVAELQNQEHPVESGGKDKNDQEGEAAEHEGEEEEAEGLVAFFRDTWAPLTIKFRHIIVIFFAALAVAAVVLMLQLEPDEEPPTTLEDGNPYLEYPVALLTYFQRADNPRAIDVYWVSGIDPDNPIDRSGTDPTNVTDVGEANYVDCSLFNPTTPEAQVWSLRTCHDVFYGNTTEYHGGEEPERFGRGGVFGPEQRRVLTENVDESDFNYYRAVQCPMQGFRDWLLTDAACDALQGFDLPCYSETRQREGCSHWDLNGNSCEPFPVPSDYFIQLLQSFMLEENVDPMTQTTPYDRFSDQIFVADNPEFNLERILQDDFSCRTSPLNNQLVLYAMSTTIKLDQDFAQNYEDGIDLYEKWNQWSIQMREAGPRHMVGTMQTSDGSWAFYYLNDTLLSETYSGIILALVLSFVVLTVIGGNIIMAFVAVGTIVLIVFDVFAFTVIMGWDLGVIEAVNYVVVIGMSIDYSVHMSEAYTNAESDTQAGRVILMMEEMGVSVLSGALSTLLAALFMFFAPNVFFIKFASFLFVTIALSCIYAMTFFPALLAIFGPLGDTGDIYKPLVNLRNRLMHNMAVDYISSKEFVRRESAMGGQHGRARSFVLHQKAEL